MNTDQEVMLNVDVWTSSRRPLASSAAASCDRFSVLASFQFVLDSFKDAFARLSAVLNGSEPPRSPDTDGQVVLDTLRSSRSWSRSFKGRTFNKTTLRDVQCLL